MFTYVMIYRHALPCCLCVVKLDSVHVHVCAVLHSLQPIPELDKFTLIFL